jgi:feruloyl esterase
MTLSPRIGTLVVACIVAAGCGGAGESANVAPAAVPAALPRLSPAEAGSLVGECSALASFTYAATTITTAAHLPEGELTVSGSPIGEHCLVEGLMNERVSAVDGQAYAIRFEMRLPVDWNGRLFHQGNGGIDGAVRPAIGTAGSGGPLSNALHKGFAVISSDAGHDGSQNPLFGLDPQARVNYGYGAVATLTPMAKALIETAYGKGPDRSYFGGSSNGGRHAMIAAVRSADEYDGVLASTPGFNLPLAAAAQLYTAQQLHSVATDPSDLSTAFTEGERATVAAAILSRCDDLDGLADGLVQDIEACRTAFSLRDHVPTCPGDRDGSCLTEAQKSAIDAMYRGPVNSEGEALYATQPYDPGLVGRGWAGWKFGASVSLDPSAVGVIFQVPPDAAILAAQPEFALDYDFDRDFPRLVATDATYTESAMSFMTPPDPASMGTLRDRGGKLVVVQGASDGVFSVDDTKDWYDALDAANAGNAAAFARFFRVPGMNHGSGGLATDQFDALAALVDWVEFGVAPDRIVATARGAGNPGGENPELPAAWAPGRTRPLCPYPAVARYDGTGDSERAESFTCR